MVPPRSTAPGSGRRAPSGGTDSAGGARFPLSLSQLPGQGNLAPLTMALPAQAQPLLAKAPNITIAPGLGKATNASKPVPSKPQLLRPQLHLQQAQTASDQAARHGGPAGLGLDSAAVRQRMVQRLRAEGVADEQVLQALAQVQRHLFVDTALVGQAYEDTSLPIGLSQTISKPSVVARMLALLMAGETARGQGHLGKVMEIGTGCGYQAALLSLLAKSVVSIERLQGLHERARSNLESLRSPSLRLLHGDGRLGHASRAPYDSIVAAAGGESMPEAWLQQLALGGRLVAPLHDSVSGQQVLVVADRRADGVHINRYELVKFVPLKSGID